VQITKSFFTVISPQTLQTKTKIFNFQQWVCLLCLTLQLLWYLSAQNFNNMALTTSITLSAEYTSYS